MSTYYGLGTKEQIFADLDTVISAVSGIVTVDYQRDEVTVDEEGYPGAYINEIGLSKTYLLQDIVKNEFVVALILFVWDETDLITALNAFIEDIKDAIMADPTRGSKAYSTRIDDLLTDAGSINPQAVAAMKVTIIFFSSE